MLVGPHKPSSRIVQLSVGSSDLAVEAHGDGHDRVGEVVRGAFDGQRVVIFSGGPAKDTADLYLRAGEQYMPSSEYLGISRGPQYRGGAALDPAVASGALAGHNVGNAGLVVHDSSGVQPSHCANTPAAVDKTRTEAAKMFLNMALVRVGRTM